MTRKAYGKDDRVEVAYTRDGYLVRVTIKGTTNHEPRDLITGLWSRLDEDDRADALNEMRTYHEGWMDPETFMPRSPGSSSTSNTRAGRLTCCARRRRSRGHRAEGADEQRNGG